MLDQNSSALSSVIHSDRLLMTAISVVGSSHATQLSKGMLLGDTYQSSSAVRSASFFFPWSSRNFHLHCQICKYFPSGTFIKDYSFFSENQGLPKTKLFTFDCSSKNHCYSLCFCFFVFLLSLTPPRGR